MSRVTFKLIAKNSSGAQELIVDPNIPEDEPEMVAITLVGEYEGEYLQIDFDCIERDILKERLTMLINQL